jgi:nucleoid-associated protein YgaU
VFVAVLLGAELAAVVSLHRLGHVEGFAPPRREIGHWLLHAPTEDLVAATARLGGLAVAWWLLVATLLSLARRVVPGWRRLRALDSMSPAALRRLVDRTVAVGLGASLGLAGMHTAGAATAPGRARVDTPVVRSPTPSLVPTAPTTSAPPPATPAPPPADALVVVRAGDNLWVIARNALENGTRVVGPAEIAPYWRRVVAANTDRLRSHDPNLNFPGERVVLPPVGDNSGPFG